MYKRKTLYDKCFKDEKGNYAVSQFPNLPLGLFIIFFSFEKLQVFLKYSTQIHQLSILFLFVWAYLELTEGVNYFRNLLGFTVCFFTIVSLF